MKGLATIPRNFYLLLLMLVVGVNALWPVFFAGGSLLIKQSQADIINAGSEKDKYTTKIFSAAEVEAKGTASASEIKLDGKMYDIVSVKKEGLYCEFTLLCDEDETLLDKAFYYYTKQQKHQRHKSIASGFMFYFFNEKPIHTHSAILTDNYFGDYTIKNIHPGYKSISSPPPKQRG